MIFRKKEKPRERFYLLPGQGGKNFQRKQLFIMRWTLAVALVCGMLAAALMWWLSKPKV